MKYLSLTTLIAAALFLPSGCVPEFDEKNLLVIVVDALRRDHLGTYGYPRDTSPNIDAFAEDAIVFEGAISQSSWTAPSVAALLTSKYPATLNPPRKGDIRGFRTFPEWLSKNGYQTAALVANPIIKSDKGYGRGFDSYRFLKQASAFKIINMAVKWIDGRDAARPFFLYLHFMDVHDPYTPPPPYDRKFNPDYRGAVDGWIGPYRTTMSENRKVDLPPEELKQLVALYDGGIAYFDSQFARLLKALKDRDLFENTAIVVTSDHGDELLDHGGVGHGHSVFDELIRVPLIVRGIGDGKPRRYSATLEGIDIAPTLMESLGIPLHYDVSGRSFLDRLNQALPFKEMAYSEIHLTFGPMKGSWYVSARGGKEKVIYSPDSHQYRFFDLVADPHESAALAETSSPEAMKLKAALHTWRVIYGSKGVTEELDPETARALRALGYIR